jgi:mono/diheme cytochrome c family protein
MTAAFAVLGIVVGLTIANHGYTLDAPADPSSDDYPARPEWYFFPLNQLMKAFHGQELIATIVIPGIIVTGLLLLPMLEKILPQRLAYVAACSFAMTVAGASGFLTILALVKDARSEDYHKARIRADLAANRAVALADRDGVPPDGSAYVLGRDPLSRGSDLFGKKCQGCHGLGDRKAAEPSAPDLEGYGSYAWVRGLLEKPDDPAYFGKVPQCGGMKEWKEGSMLSARELDDVALYVAEFAKVPPEVTPAEWADDPKVKDHPGRKLYQKECAECHTMGDPGARSKKLQPAPDLFAWGSDRWTARMIKHPGSTSYYGHLEEEEEQKMPAFAGQITDADVSTLVRYLKGDYYRPEAAVDSKAKAKAVVRAR